jgi:DNA-binding NtrC family response regulator
MISPQKIQQFHKIIWASEPMQEIYQTIIKVANSKATILITGETGTGKELCAHAIHQQSQRRDKPYVIFNCAATTNHNLMESELFGHVKGAFTGADNHLAAASRAKGGILFLDEIGELDLKLQRKLLRFIETNRFQKLGADKLENVDIRILCATNRHLPTEIKAGRFREDLYYCLATVIMPLPPLRDRGDDVLLLAQKFLDKYSLQSQKKFGGFVWGGKKFLLSYKWPGNVRQLKSCIQNLVLLNDDGKKVTSEMLIAALGNDTSCLADITTSLSQSTEPSQKLIPNVAILNSNNTLRTLEEIEKDVILAAIRHCDGNVMKAATELGMGYATVYRRLREWKLS